MLGHGRPAGPARPSRRSSSGVPPRPRIVEHHAGQTWVGIKWEAGYDYDSYFINITGPFGTAKGPRELRTIHHDDDGTWGYQRVDGLLPGRAYGFSVQGCTETFFGLGDDRCWDWAAGVPRVHLDVSAALRARHLCTALRLAGGVRGRPGLCRGAPTPQVAADNAQAQSRRAYTCTPPNCTFTAPDTCKVPFVWREARPSDHVCVTVPERSQVAAENALANQRRAAPR